jgi:hypothetical protein
MHRAFQKLITYLKAAWNRFFHKKDKNREVICEPEEWQNPYILEARSIIEQILAQRGLDYQRFRPTILDADFENRKFGTQEDIDLVLEQLTKGLNFLEICTDRPEHFLPLQEKLWQEEGLAVRIIPTMKKSETNEFHRQLYGNMILDFERYQPVWADRFLGEVMYLPFYKRRWVPTTGENIAFTGEENLDIEVPIGYNMVIVKTNESIY